MKNNKALWITFGFFQQMASWGALLAYGLIKYGEVVQKNGLTVALMFIFVLTIWLVMRSLKDTAENGFGLFKKTARGVRKLIPLLIGLMIVVVLNRNIGNMVDILLFAIAGNIIAVPLGVLSYYCSPQYIADTGMVEVVKHINND